MTHPVDSHINLDGGQISLSQLETWETLKLGQFTVKGLKQSISGLNMHYLGPDGQSPIGLLMKSDKSLSATSQLYKVMIEQGANPFRLDCPFQHDTGISAKSLVTVLRDHEEKTGRKIRGENGCNAYHCWLYSQPRTHEYNLMMLTKKKQDDPVLRGWLTEKTLVDGDTPLHRLWQAVINNPPTQQPSIASQYPYDDPSLTVWSVTQVLLDFGADFSIENSSGETAADLALFCVETKKIRVPPHARKIISTFKRMMAEHNSSKMPARSTGSRALRL